MEITKKGDMIRNYTGILKVKVISNEPTRYSPAGYTEFEILESKKLGESISNNICTYMNGYGCAYCHFSESYDEIVKHHDNQIKEYAKDQTTYNREVMLKKLINSPLPKVSKIESESITWFKSLSAKEKKYVSWLKNYYDEIY